MSAKRCQDAPKSDLAAIWARFGTLRGGPKPSKTVEKQGFSRFSYFSKGAGNRVLKSSQRRPPGDENGSQERPGSGQERPKRRQNSARSGQARPRSAPRAAQEANKRSKQGSSYRFRSWGLREASGGRFEEIWERFWSLRGGILEPCSRDFSFFETIR